MDNNSIFRQLRYIFKLQEEDIVKMLSLVEVDISKETVTDWLRKEDDPKMLALYDKDFAAFLNALIILKRGKKNGEIPKAEKSLSNNLILRKLKIALNLKTEDILEILQLANFNFGKSELAALFRNPDHKHYRKCKDQVLRNFLMGLKLKIKE